MGEWTNTYQQPDDKKRKQFLSKIWKGKKYNRKAEWIYNMEKEVEELEGPMTKIHLDHTEEHSKKALIGKRQIMRACMDTGCKILKYPQQTGYQSL